MTKPLSEIEKAVIERCCNDFSIDEITKVMRRKRDIIAEYYETAVDKSKESTTVKKEERKNGAFVMTKEKSERSDSTLSNKSFSKRISRHVTKIK